MRRTAMFFVSCLTVSCVSALQARTSGLVGCEPDDITIDHQNWSPLTGHLQSWQAHCNGTTYQCSNAGAAVACTPMQDRPQAARLPSPTTPHTDAASSDDDDSTSDESTSESPPQSGGSGASGGVRCRLAFQHIEELAAAWAEWHPDRTAKAPPGRMEFLSVCHDLSKEQQACLVMPWGRKHRDDCAPYFDALAPQYRARIDGLFLAPPLRGRCEPPGLARHAAPRLPRQEPLNPVPEPPGDLDSAHLQRNVEGFFQMLKGHRIRV